MLELLKAMPEIVHCDSITGSSGLMIRVAVDSMGTLQALIARLMQYVLYVTHWAACMYYYIARVDAFGPESYVSRNAARFEGQPLARRYLLSLYMSVSIFVGERGTHLAAACAQAAARSARCLLCLTLRV